MTRREWGSIGPRLPPRRKYISRGTIDEVRERAGDRCEDCGRPLAKEIEVRHPPVIADGILVKLLPYRCWKCAAEMKAVHVELAHGGEPLHYIEEVREPVLGELLRSQYPWFKPSFSKTAGYTYYGNRCPECTALQGHFYVTEKAIGLADEGKEVEEALLPWMVMELQPSSAETETKRWGNLHHMDIDPANNDLSNLRLLCVRCHRRRHEELTGGAEDD